MSETEAETRIGVSEATDRLQRRGVIVDTRTVRRWCATGRIPAQRIGARYFISQTVVERLVKVEES